MQSFCCVMTMKSGTIVLAVILMILSIAVIISNIPYLDFADPTTTITLLILLWAILAFISGILTCFSAINENRGMALIAIYLQVFTFIYWFSLSMFPYFYERDSTVLEKVCMGSRCGDSLWMVDQDWRWYHTSAEHPNATSTTIRTTTSTHSNKTNTTIENPFLKIKIRYCCRLQDLAINDTSRNDILQFLKVMNNSQSVLGHSKGIHNLNNRLKFTPDTFDKSLSDGLTAPHIYTPGKSETTDNPKQLMFPDKRFYDWNIRYNLSQWKKMSSNIKTNRNVDLPFSQKKVKSKGNKYWATAIYCIYVCFFFYCMVVLILYRSSMSKPYPNTPATTRNLI